MRREAEPEMNLVEENLRPDAARELLEVPVRDGTLRTTATVATKVLPTASRFGPGAGHRAEGQSVIKKLGTHFEQFFGLGNGGNE